jgi:hypothetical protein
MCKYVVTSIYFNILFVGSGCSAMILHTLINFNCYYYGIIVPAMQFVLHFYIVTMLLSARVIN